MFERTPQFEAYIASAKPYRAIWRIVPAIVTGLLVYAAMAVFMVSLTTGLAEGFLDLESDTLDAFTLVASNGETPVAMVVLLSTFLGMGLGAVAMAFWHWRGFASLIGPLPSAFRYFIDTLSIAVPVFVIVGLVISLTTEFNLLSQTPLSTWANLMLIGLPLLLIQVGAEELVFRGYLTQQLAARFRSFWIWGVFPSILFGLAHFSGEFDPVMAGLIVLATGFFGFVATDLTRLTGTLGAATGLHFANNFVALFLVAVPGELSGLALYLTPFTMADTHIVQPLILLDILVIGAVWQLLRRRYR